MSDTETLTRAAELLEELARDIYDCNTFEDQWIKGTASERGEYEELIEVADTLRRMAVR